MVWTDLINLISESNNMNILASKLIRNGQETFRINEDQNLI